MSRNIALVRQIALAGITASAVFTSGCATVGDPIGGFKQVVQDPQKYYITNAVGDPCARLRQPFVDVRKEQRQTVAKWAALGTAAGVAAGAAIDSRNRLRGALIGAVVGLASGATAGYYADLQKRAKTTESLRETVFSDAKGDVRSSDDLIQAVTRLNRCRLTSIQAVAADVQDKKISKEEAEKRLAEIKRATAEDNQLIASAAQGLEKRTNFYVNALKQSGAENPQAYIAEAAAYKPVVIKPKYTVRRAGAKPQGVTIKQRSRRGETTVTSVAKNSSELAAIQVAHQEVVDEAASDVQAMLL